MHECKCKVGDVVYSKNMRCLVILWSDRVCDWKNKIKQTLGALLTSSRVVNSVEERIRKKRSRLRPLIGVIKFMTNGKERVVIRVGCVICAGGGGALRVSAARRTGRVNYWSTSGGEHLHSLFLSHYNYILPPLLSTDNWPSSDILVRADHYVVFIGSWDCQVLLLRRIKWF